MIFFSSQLIESTEIVNDKLDIFNTIFDNQYELFCIFHVFDSSCTSVESQQHHYSEILYSNVLEIYIDCMIFSF